MKSSLKRTFLGIKSEKTNRHRPSRWQDAENDNDNDAPFPMKPFSYGHDQDMRIQHNRFVLVTIRVTFLVLNGFWTSHY